MILQKSFYVKQKRLICNLFQRKDIYSKLGKKFSFSAHMTIARVKRKPSQELISKLKTIENTELGEQNVKEFVLKKSTLTPRGPIYETIEVFSSSEKA